MSRRQIIRCTSIRPFCDSDLEHPFILSCEENFWVELKAWEYIGAVYSQVYLVCIQYTLWSANLSNGSNFTASWSWCSKLAQAFRLWRQSGSSLDPLLISNGKALVSSERGVIKSFRLTSVRSPQKSLDTFSSSWRQFLRKLGSTKSSVKNKW